MNILLKLKVHLPMLIVILKIIRDLPFLIKSVMLNKRRFRFSAVKHLNEKILNGFVVLGSGPTVNELTESQINCISNKVSMAVGRWIYHDFVPDIYLMETGKSEQILKWLKDFCKILHEKKEDYKNTIILIDNIQGDAFLQDLIEDIFPNSLKQNLYYTQTIKPPHETIETFSSFLKFMKLTKINYMLGLMAHCRSSAVSSSMLGHYIGAKEISLVGVDGFTGYFMDESHKDFHADYGGVDKNYNQVLHSTSNPEYGVPTVTDCFILISKYYTPCFVSSKNALLSKYLELTTLEDEFV